MIAVARLFWSGKDQAVRLPIHYRFEGDEIYIKKQGKSLLLMPKNEAFELFYYSLRNFTTDFMDERIQLPLPIRQGVFD
ncbi:MAG: AbrB/MazE/SpoVT family DNA-binding domain-containing protein [Leptospiraceae bacterium]|nr:AbrB/MazE/SpoVT family DNA-binding domain-containing protein [Leptospiraceae bacterium]MCP5494699.1 AbrB/MazE/SpoVT family DNA-binding domain-containing protein [Leptospiraceae bacterium]